MSLDKILDMLYIKEGDVTRLPEEYHNANNVAAHIYDQLTDLVSNDAHSQYFKHTPFKVPPGEESTLEAIKSENTGILDWLRQKGMNEELEVVLVKHVTLSILSDISNFLYESLNNAQKGKMTVAYALLRKPFTDELLLLEQILIDSEKFIQNFFHKGDIDLYDPASRRNSPDKNAIVEAAHKRIVFPILSSEMIYQLRYDKSYSAGINGISNQALHIVTADRAYKTLDQNLNFVFSGPDDQARYLKHYYYFVPLLLIYAAAIADEIMFQFLPEIERKYYGMLKKIKRLIAMDKLMLPESEGKITAIFAEIFSGECNECGSQMQFDQADFNLFFETNNFICSSCFTSTEYSDKNIEDISHVIDLISKSLYVSVSSKDKDESEANNEV